jgi:hypothetical protein
MAAADRTWPVRIELGERAVEALLKHTPKGKRLTARLVAADLDPTRRGRPVYVFEGSRGDALLLRALAVAYAPEVVKTIDRALKRTA